MSLPHQPLPSVQHLQPLHRRSLCLALLASALPLSSMSQVTGIGDAINKAGRQRMLSQRLVKAWLALAQNVQIESARRVLDQSLALFDRQQVELRAFAPAGETRDTFSTLEAAWSEYKALLVGANPSQERAKVVMSQSAKVLLLANKGTQLLELAADKPSAKLVNVAGRQRMLSQRMAANFMVSAWSSDAAVAREITKDKDEFVAVLKMLREGPEATAQIKQELAQADHQWLFFDNALGSKLASTKAASDVFVSSENLLTVMDRITGMYARILA